MSDDVPLEAPPRLASRVEIYDTTLRDGSQREGISYTLEDKIRIAARLDGFGVSFIEGGWPGSNPKDCEFFARAKERTWRNARLVAFGSTRRADVAASDDLNLRALVSAGTPVCTIFGKSSLFHVTEVLRIDAEQNLRMIEDSCAFVKAAGKRVIYDAEHFFDAYAADAAYALETLARAKAGGAETLVLCDTNGGSLPWQIESIVRAVARELKHPLGIHAHDDTGCGVANSLAAVRAGVSQVQGTINGYGERTGNANLCVLIPNLVLKLGAACGPQMNLAELSELSHFVAEVANVTPDDHMAYVGRSAFAHKGGVHVAAMRRNRDSYQHIDPERVGNHMRVVVSELSGRGNVLSKAEELGVEVEAGTEVSTLGRIKAAEARGISYDSAEASVALVLKRGASDYAPLFRVLDYQVQVGRRGEADTFAEATVKLQMGKQIVHTVSEGNGPVSALDAALRKALLPSYPETGSIHLTDYKVRILDSAAATGAVTRVLIDSRDERKAWSTVGASTNMIEASLQALVDSLEYGLSDMLAERAPLSKAHAQGDRVR